MWHVLRELVPPLIRCRRAAAGLALLTLQGCVSLLHVADGTSYRSADGRRTAQVQHGRVVVDGKASTLKFDGIANGGVALSDDGQRIAYVGMRGSKNFLVVDDSEHGPFDSIAKSGVQVTPKGRHVALPLVQDDRWHLWLDGRLDKPHDGFAEGHPRFSADDVRVVYAVRDGKTWTLIVDGVAQPPIQGFVDDGIGFTSSGELYVGFLQADGWRVRLGDATSEAFDAINKPGLMLGPRGRSLAFIARKGQQVFVCIDLVCGKPHRGVGARVFLDGSTLGEDLANAVVFGIVGGVLGAAAGLPAYANPMVTMPTPGGSVGRYITVGSVVMSPDERHHAYVASDDSDAIIIDGVPALTVPAQKSVEWMRFEDSSQVLMLRLSGSSGLQAVAVPGTAQHEGASDPASAAFVDLGPAGADLLVFVDGRFAGVSPSRVSLSPGEHVLRLQAPRRVGRSVTISATAGQELTLDSELAIDPVRAAVAGAIAALDDASLTSVQKAKPDQVLQGRLLAAVPLSEDLLGVARYGGSTEDALVFGDSAIYVRTASSSRSSSPRRHAVAYADFARRPLPTDHAAFEVTLAPGVIIMTAGMSLPRERLIELLHTLHSRLALAAAAPR